MSLTKRNSPCVFRARAMAAMLASCTKRRFQCRRFGQGSGWIRSIRVSEPGGTHPRSSMASPANRRMLPILCASIRVEDLGHAVDVGLAADEPHVRKGQRLGDQMFAAAKSDLEPDLVGRRIEQGGEIGRGRLSRYRAPGAARNVRSGRPDASAAGAPCGGRRTSRAHGRSRHHRKTRSRAALWRL